MIQNRFLNRVVGAMIAAMSLSALGLAQADEPEPRDYVFVFLKTGPTTDLTEEQQAEAFAGHFANMTRMAEAGELLIAGPFGDPKSDPVHRGLFVLDVGDLEKGMEITSSDPTTKLGVFVQSGHVFTTDAPLSELPSLEKEAEVARDADPDTPEFAGMRGYMLVTSPFSVELLGKLSGTDGVLIAGRLHESGPDADGDGTHDDEVLAWLDATDVETAEAILGDGGNGDGVEESVDWTVHGWYGSTQIEKMAD